MSFKTILILIVVTIISVIIYWNLDRFRYSILKDLHNQKVIIKNDINEYLTDQKNEISRIIKDNFDEMRKINLLNNQHVTRIANHYTETDDDSVVHSNLKIYDNAYKSFINGKGKQDNFYMSEESEKSIDSNYASTNTDISPKNIVCDGDACFIVNDSESFPTYKKEETENYSDNISEKIPIYKTDENESPKINEDSSKSCEINIKESYNRLLVDTGLLGNNEISIIGEQINNLNETLNHSNMTPLSSAISMVILNENCPDYSTIENDKIQIIDDEDEDNSSKNSNNSFKNKKKIREQKSENTKSDIEKNTENEDNNLEDESDSDSDSDSDGDNNSDSDGDSDSNGDNNSDSSNYNKESEDEESENEVIEEDEDNEAINLIEIDNNEDVELDEDCDENNIIDICDENINDDYEIKDNSNEINLMEQLNDQIKKNIGKKKVSKDLRSTKSGKSRISIITSNIDTESYSEGSEEESEIGTEDGIENEQEDILEYIRENNKLKNINYYSNNDLKFISKEYELPLSIKKNNKRKVYKKKELYNNIKKYLSQLNK